MKRIVLLLTSVLLVSFGSGCCCTKGWFGSSYATAPAPVYTAPPTYYAPPATTVAPTTVQAPVYSAPVVTQPCCPCTCP